MVSFILPGNSATGGYDVANSLRFNSGSSDSLTRSTTAGNRTTWTFSTWFKRSKLGVLQSILQHDDVNYFRIRITSGDVFEVFDSNGNNTWNWNPLLRDTSAWYHIVLRGDSTDGTNGNRLRLYINGTLASANTVASISQNYTFSFNQGGTLQIGKRGSTDYLDGYLAETILIDGSALAPDQFGEFDSDSGIWKPIDVSGLTFGTRGFYLDFESSGSLGADVSGNGNNFTVNNLTSIDQSTDTCTNNFATYNSIFGQGRQDLLTYAEGNLSVTSSHTTGSDTTSTSTFAFDSGKWYAEFKLTSSADGVYVGVATSNLNFTNSGIDTSGNSNCWITRGDDGTVRNNGSTAYFGTSFSNNDIIQIAIDMDNSKIWWGLNGTYGNSGNPSTGSNPAYSNLSGELMIIVGDNYSDRTPTILANFGSPPYSISSGNSDGNGYGNMEYEIPSGYYILNSKNLAEYG